MQKNILDCLIVGGGAGGLTAAIYLSRYRRIIEVIDAGQSRLHLIPTSHNYPGFVDGITGTEFYVRLKDQAIKYGARCTTGMVDTLAKREDGTFVATVGDRRFFARTIIFATGVQDIEPDVVGLAEGIESATVRYCPVCDGFEAIGKRVAILGNGEHGLHEAIFLKTYTTDLTLITGGPSRTMDPALVADIDAHAINLINQRLLQIACSEIGGVTAGFEDGTTQQFDILYSMLGLNVMSSLAVSLGAICDDSSQVQVNEHMESSVKGFYAVGDVAHGLNQISVATGQAAIAATAVHNFLRGDGE